MRNEVYRIRRWAKPSTISLGCNWMFVPNKLRLDPSLATTLNSVSLHVEEARAAISQLGLDHHDATKDHVNALESKLSKWEKWVKGARGLSTSFGQADKSIEAATTFCGLLIHG